MVKFPLLTLLSIALCACCHQHTEMVFVGDIMLDRGTRTTIEKHDANFLFGDFKSIFKQSDFTIANFESTVCDTSLKPQLKKFTFRAKPEWLLALVTGGVTHVGVANNHSYDYGAEGFRQTVESIKASGIGLLTYCDSVPTICEKNGSRIALFSTNFLAKGSCSFCAENEVSLIRYIKEYKAANPTTVVVVFVHWGTEMQPTPTATQVRQAHKIVDAGANAIVGHHPHVVQTVERFKGRYIFYSLGNFIFDCSKPPSNQGVVAKFTISNGEIESVHTIPYSIYKSKPTPMSNSAATQYIQTIQQLSPTVKFEKSHGVWEVI